MAKVNNFQLGLFVVGGVILLIVCVFILGMRDAFVPKARLAALIRDSVQGVNVGAQVKYKGVLVGSVTKLSIMIEDQVIQMEMALDMRAFSSKKADWNSSTKYFYEFLEEEVKHGLRCRLEYAGITGIRYVELDYLNEPQKLFAVEDINFGLKGEFFYIPVSASRFSDIVKLINTSLEKIGKVDFDKISDSMSQTLQATRKLLENPNLELTIKRLESMSINLDQASSGISRAFTEERLNDLRTGLNSAVKSFEELTKVSKEAIEGAKLPETTGAVRGASNSIAELEKTLHTAILKLNRAVDSISELAKMLEANPSSLLRGKEQTTIFKMETP
ncbi:MAG: MlaD family protein [Victivallaceae bacterium]|nr:MlaD family protein [Victivallaceae bacterium]MDD4181696.1 MlaD family protein [Victivallaceae bacterium]